MGGVVYFLIKLSTIQFHLNFALFITGLMLGRSKHEEVSTGQCLLAKHRVRMRRSRDSIVDY